MTQREKQRMAGDADGIRQPQPQPQPQVNTVQVSHQGQRPLLVGAQTHFFEVDSALQFERWKAYGMRPAIPDGAVLRFKPGRQYHIELIRLDVDQLDEHLQSA